MYRVREEEGENKYIDAVAESVLANMKPNVRAYICVCVCVCGKVNVVFSGK